MKFLPKILPRSAEERQAEVDRRLIRQEAKLGGQLFGSVPEGHSRQFFCLDEHTWVWHEEWLQNGERQAMTTHYTMRPDGVLKSQDGHYRRLSSQEARNLYRAIKIYHRRITTEYQRLLQAA